MKTDSSCIQHTLEYLFVYGTLRKARDGSVHPFLRQSQFFQPASVAGRLYLIGHYPGAVVDSLNSGSRIQGEVYRLPEPVRQFEMLDDYEECTEQYPQPHEYRRIAVKTRLSNGLKIQTWMYEFNHQVTGLKWLTGGDYITYLPQTHPHRTD